MGGKRINGGVKAEVVMKGRGGGAGKRRGKGMGKGRAISRIRLRELCESRVLGPNCLVNRPSIRAA